ncbi:futalosine hydrolase [Stieleria marina]|uniref:Futalosine hydrolase n=1 Tax=Stieleria marina TaxID=1930275 RepID=A0A517NZ31_9BACT|nr:Futalosine hydrolase [Planctomycetes bacterium K23_9]
MPNLILVPTKRERSVIEPLLSDAATQRGWQIEIVGFGPLASAARASQLISRHRPSKVCLVGVAGAFDIRECPVGNAMQFRTVECDGIGVGTGPEYRSVVDMGWSMFDDETISVGARIGLHHDERGGSEPRESNSASLLTVCAASANTQEASSRRRRFPDAVAEDMEGFAVAVSCQLAGVPLRIVRGISNEVGDRDHGRWQIDPALESAARMVNDEVIGDTA